MSKNRLILAATGGIIAVLALAAAAGAYISYSAKVAAVEGDEESDGLEAVVAKVQRFARASVYPCQKSVKELDESSEKVAEWLKSVRSVAAAGDRVYSKTTPAAFKTFLVNDAKRLSSLPGEAGGHIARAEFAFGPFKNYITGGEMPSEQKLPELQRTWDDIATLIEMLSAAGISELIDIQSKVEEKKVEKEPDDPAARRRARRQKKKANAVKAGEENKVQGHSVAHSYVFVFSARQHSLVKVVNAFATSERFITVDDFSFRRATDVIADAFAVDEKKAENSSGRSRRRRREASVISETPQEDAKAAGGIVTDPQRDQPINVTMTLTVHDFRSLEDSEKSEEAQK